MGKRHAKRFYRSASRRWKRKIPRIDILNEDRVPRRHIADDIRIKLNGDYLVLVEFHDLNKNRIFGYTYFPTKEVGGIHETLGITGPLIAIETNGVENKIEGIRFCELNKDTKSRLIERVIELEEEGKVRHIERPNFERWDSYGRFEFQNMPNLYKDLRLRRK